MKRNSLLLTVGLLVAALFVLLQVLFTVREGQAAVVTTFGKPVRAITEAGLYMRWPWPVQRVYRFDNRIHTLEGAFEEMHQEGPHTPTSQAPIDAVASKSPDTGVARPQLDLIVDSLTAWPRSRSCCNWRDSSATLRGVCSE